MSVEVVNEDDAVENFVAAISDLPSALRSQVHRSHSSSGAEKVTGGAKFVALKVPVCSAGMNLRGDLADNRVMRLTTSTDRNVA